MESSHAPHDLIYLPKGSDYYVNNLHQEYTACINFQIQEPPDVPLSGEPFLLHCSNHSRMEQLYSEAVKARRRQAPGRIYSCCAALNQILALAQTEIMRPYMISEQEKRMQSAIDYIDVPCKIRHVTAAVYQKPPHCICQGADSFLHVYH